MSAETPVLSPSLRASIDRAAAEIPAGKRGYVAAGASLTGVEVAVATRGPFGVMVGGYAKRLWGGKGYDAGARATLAW